MNKTKKRGGLNKLFKGLSAVKSIRNPFQKVQGKPHPSILGAQVLPSNVINRENIIMKKEHVNYKFNIMQN